MRQVLPLSLAELNNARADAVKHYNVTYGPENHVIEEQLALSHVILFNLPFRNSSMLTFWKYTPVHPIFSNLDIFSKFNTFSIDVKFSTITRMEKVLDNLGFKALKLWMLKYSEKSLYDGSRFAMINRLLVNKERFKSMLDQIDIASMVRLVEAWWRKDKILHKKYPIIQMLRNKVGKDGEKWKNQERILAGGIALKRMPQQLPRNIVTSILKKVK